MRVGRFSIMLALVCAALPAAQARDASSYSTQELVEALAMQRFGNLLRSGPTRNSPPNDAAIVLLQGKALSLASRLQSVPGMRVLTQVQLVAEQRANFLIISQLGAQGSDILIDYDTPRNASFGTLRVQEEDGKLVFKAEESFRSSSGARATYTRLYGGLPCRDDSEIAYTFNFLTSSGADGKCRVDHFPGSESVLGWYK